MTEEIKNEVLQERSAIETLTGLTGVPALTKATEITVRLRTDRQWLDELGDILKETLEKAIDTTSDREAVSIITDKLVTFYERKKDSYLEELNSIPKAFNTSNKIDN